MLRWMVHEARDTWGAGWLGETEQARFAVGLAESGRFLMREGKVHAALGKLVALLEADGIPYAIIGGLALIEYGHLRVAR